MKQFLCTCVLTASALFLPRLAAQEPAQLTPEQRAAFRSAKSVRVVVDQSYVYWRSVSLPRGVSLPFERVSKRLFGYAGLGSTPAPPGGPELEVRIRAVGEAGSSQFRDIFGQGPVVTRYTKADVEGEITLVGPEQSSYTKRFRGHHSVGNLLLEQKGTGGYRDPSDAPFQEAFEAEDSFVAVTVALISEVYGVPPLAAALQDESAAVRGHAVEALGATNDPAGVEPLLAALRDKEATVRKAAAKALGALGDARAVEPLVAAMADKEYSVGWEAGAALGKISDPRASQAAVAALQSSSDKHTRLYAAVALKQRKDPATIEPLVAALGDPDSDVRRVSLEALTSFRDPRAVDVFIRMAKDNDESLRREAVWTLSKIDDPRAVDALLEALRDRDSDVRRSAMSALAERKEPRAIPILVQALSDQEWAVRINAASALGKITGQPFGDDVKKWQRWWQKQSRH